MVVFRFRACPVIGRVCLSVTLQFLGFTMPLGGKESESFTEIVATVQGEPDDFILLEERKRKRTERKLLRKLDMRVMPTVVIIYLMNYIDVSWSILTVRWCCSRVGCSLGV